MPGWYAHSGLSFPSIRSPFRTKEFPIRNALPALIAIVVLTSSVARADIESGPNVGTAVSVLKVFATTGDHAGREVDYAKDRGAKPTVYVFIPYDRFDRPLARMLKAIEKAAVEAGNDASVVTVFLAAEIGRAHV